MMKTISKHRSIIWIGIFFAVLIVVIFFGVSHSNAAVSVPTEVKVLNVTLIGDSYSSGNGAGNYFGEEGSYRSHNNWASNYVSWLSLRDIKVTYQNLAYGGKTTERVLREQVDEVPSNTDLVMMTVGGNDVKFTGIVDSCFAITDGGICSKFVNQAGDKLDAVMVQTEEIFKKLEERLQPSAQIVLVGYPLLSTDTDHILSWCEHYYKSSKKCLLTQKYNASKGVRELGKKANQKQAELVQKWNSDTKHKIKITYIDTISESFAGHEPNPSHISRNPKRWINEFLETKGQVDSNGITQSTLSLVLDEWYHPNITGHQKIAQQVSGKIGIPSSVRTVTPNSSDVDVVFVIETTKSMVFDLARVKQDIKNSMAYYQARARTIRFALVDYRDQTDSLVTAPEYSAVKVRSSFVYDPSQFMKAIDKLEIGGDLTGPASSASLYSGTVTAMNQLDWRTGVRKLMVIIGNLPAQDPEPLTKYTWQSVKQKAYALDPVEIYAIDSEGSDLSDSVNELVAETGGLAFSDSQNILESTSAAIDNSINKPFGWIQGPYIVKVGESLTLDARGSYAVNGNIASVDWDLDGDGLFETHSNDLLYTHQFNTEFSGTIGVRVTDTNRMSGIGSTQLDVSDDGDAIPHAVDNCPDIANQNQTDIDNDGIGDDCDDDIDYRLLFSNGDDSDNDDVPPIESDEPGSSLPSDSIQDNSKFSISRKASLLTASADSVFNNNASDDSSFAQNESTNPTSQIAAINSRLTPTDSSNKRPQARSDSWLQTIIIICSIMIGLAIISVIHIAQKQRVS